MGSIPGQERSHMLYSMAKKKKSSIGDSGFLPLLRAITSDTIFIRLSKNDCWQEYHCVTDCVCSVTYDSLLPMDCSLPGSSVHGIFQARILERVAISFSSESSQPRDGTHISCIGRRILYHWATWEVQEHYSLCYLDIGIANSETVNLSCLWKSAVLYIYVHICLLTKSAN